MADDTRDKKKATPSRPQQTRSPKRLGATLLGDLRRGDLTRSLKRDLSDTYEFYLDDEEKAELTEMGRFRRSLVMVWWLLKRIFIELSSVRRLVLLLAVVLAVDGFGSSPTEVSVGFLLVLVVLVLELKDKLLAQDELAAGRAVQLALMPADQPRLSGWQIYLCSTPANEVGGDLVDYVQMDGGMGVALGDVAGKGLGAALYMSQLQATLRALAPRAPALSELGRQLNEVLLADRLPNRFATLVYVRLWEDSGRVELVNAGQDPPIIVRGMHLETLPDGAPALGIVDTARFEPNRFDLAPGEMLVAYSDGITEARNEEGEFFGTGRLKTAIRVNAGRTAEDLGERLVQTLNEFIGDARVHDDVSLLILCRVDDASRSHGDEIRALPKEDSVEVDGIVVSGLSSGSGS